jgi:hypothetical protein
VPEKSKPSAADWVLVVPPTGGRGRKRLHPATRRSNLVPQINQVMTQAELPPYHGSRSPLDLVAIKNIFGRIFEAFRQISQASATGAAPTADNKPLNRLRYYRYLNILFLYLKTCLYIDMCYTVGCLMLVSHLKLLRKSLLVCWRHLLRLLLLLSLLWQEQV